MVKINIRGGILSPGDLMNIVFIASQGKADTLHLGERQNIYFYVSQEFTQVVNKSLEGHKYDFEVDNNMYPNIVTSYVTEDLFTSYNGWLSEGVYRDVLDSFNYKPKLKINIVNSTQGLAPLFTGNLNFISSQSSNFWYLFIRQRSAKTLECWPELIYGSDISLLSQCLEEILLHQKDISIFNLHQKVNEKHHFITLEKEQDMVLPRVRFPNYEGMNKSGEQYWLGIYRRNNDFPLAFMKDLCALCLETKIGLLHLTPWKSMLIKGIAEAHRIKWEKLLGKYGINIRHSSAELNWQIKDGDKFALKLKKYLVKQFDKRDVRTYGLSFAIRTGPMNVFSSVVIDRNPVVDLLGIKALDQYDISYSDGFNPNNQHFTKFAQKLSKKHLPDYLTELCRFYYEQLNTETVSLAPPSAEEEFTEISWVYQCTHCFTVYDEKTGDAAFNIPPGTSFEDISDTYVCPLCENPKKDFLKKQIHLNSKHN